MRAVQLAPALAAVALAAAIAGLPDLRIAAEDATPAALADHPVVGAWRWRNDPVDPIATTYAIIHADGTYTEVSGDQTGVGVWWPVGERGVGITEVFQDIEPDPNVFAPGTVTVRQAYELDASGDTLTGTYAVDARLPDGTVVFQGVLEGTGTRMEPEPMAPFATPTGGRRRLDRATLAESFACRGECRESGSGLPTIGQRIAQGFGRS